MIVHFPYSQVYIHKRWLLAMLKTNYHLIYKPTTNVISLQYNRLLIYIFLNIFSVSLFGLYLLGFNSVCHTIMYPNKLISPK